MPHHRHRVFPKPKNTSKDLGRREEHHRSHVSPVSASLQKPIINLSIQSDYQLSKHEARYCHPSCRLCRCLQPRCFLQRPYCLEHGRCRHRDRGEGEAKKWEIMRRCTNVKRMRKWQTLLSMREKSVTHNQWMVMKLEKGLLSSSLTRIMWHVRMEIPLVLCIILQFT